MSEGPQGVQGEQGVRGIQGPEGGRVPGPQGERGEKGEKGEKGGHFERKVVFSFVALVLIATLVTGVQGYALKELERTTDGLEQEIVDRCEDGRINRVAIRRTLIESLEALGYRYDAETGQVVRAGPPIDYYATRETELRAALAHMKAALNRFPVINCK